MSSIQYDICSIQWKKKVWPVSKKIVSANKNCLWISQDLKAFFRNISKQQKETMLEELKESIV